MKPMYAGLPPHWHLSLWATMLVLVAYLVVGQGLGVAYFASGWWNARQFVAGGRALPAVASMIGRFVLLGGLLALASLEGALPMLLMALGVLTARPLVVRYTGRVA